MLDKKYEIIKKTGWEFFKISDALKYGSIEKALIMDYFKAISGSEPQDQYFSCPARQLAKRFPYMKSASIKRWLRELEGAGWLHSTQPHKKKMDSTKFYRITERR